MNAFNSDQNDKMPNKILMNYRNERVMHFKTTINIAFIAHSLATKLFMTNVCVCVQQNSKRSTAFQNCYTHTHTHTTFSANNYAVYYNDTAFYALFVAQIDFLVNLVSMFALYAVTSRYIRYVFWYIYMCVRVCACAREYVSVCLYLGSDTWFVARYYMHLKWKLQSYANVFFFRYKFM